MTSFVFGIDPGTQKIGLALMKDGKFIRVDDLKGDTSLPRRLRIPKLMEEFQVKAREVFEIVEANEGVLFIGFEQPTVKFIQSRRGLTSSVFGTIALSEVVGCMKMILWQMGAEPDFIFDVSTTKAKRKLAGHGRASKEDVLQAALALLKLDMEDPPKLTYDRADAVAVAFAVWAEIQPALISGELDQRIKLMEQGS